MVQQPAIDTAAEKPICCRKLRIYGVAYSLKAYEIRDFLNRSVVEFEWNESSCPTEVAANLGLPPLGFEQMPVVAMPGGRLLLAPSIKEIAAALGWIAQPKLKEYDISIYGAGPAGLSAAVYAASEGLSTVLIEREAVGGQAGTSSLIENYMGFPDGISGRELAKRAREQALKFGAEILLLQEGVAGVFKNDRVYVTNADGDVLISRANICATGVEYRRLNLVNESKFLGRGLYYGVGTSEAMMCNNNHVFVIGGGNSAGQAVMNFCRYADKVTMVVRGGCLGATLSQYLVDRIEKQGNVEVLYHSEIVRLCGDTELQEVILRGNRDGRETAIKAQKLFVCIGGEPQTDWTETTDVMRDAGGYIITGQDMVRDGAMPACWTRDRPPFHLETSIPGVFAAGDVRHNSIKRVASAVGEGAMAVTFAHKFLAETS